MMDETGMDGDFETGAETPLSDRLGLREMDNPTEKNEVWHTVEEFAENLDVSTVRPGHPKRDLWYVPTVLIATAHRTALLLSEFDIEEVYDLGAGDCRLSLWLAEKGYDVVAYEANGELVDAVRDRFDMANLEIRCRDYYRDFEELTGTNAAVISYGGTNELPGIPESGLGIEGYSEIGRRVWYDGKIVAAW